MKQVLKAPFVRALLPIAALLLSLAGSARATNETTARQSGIRAQAATTAALLFQGAAPEGAEGRPEEGKGEEHSPMEEVYHWVNFLILVGGLAYLVKKLLIPFLQERSRLIREDMERSAKRMVDADERLAMIEDKLRGLQEELASLRQAASHESAAERGRVEQAASADAQKILAAVDQEIEAALKTARQDLKVYTSELALGLAEKKIRSSLTPQSEERILHAFVKDLSSGNGEAGRK